jgi:hypothetical protein
MLARSLRQCSDNGIFEVESLTVRLRVAEDEDVDVIGPKRSHVLPGRSQSKAIRED